MEAEERPQKMRKVDHSEAAQPKGNLEVSHEVDESATNGKTVAEASHEPTQDRLPIPSDTAPMVETNPAQKDLGGMSKNQLKKLRKKAEWEAGREERKSIRKEKTTAKRERKKVAKREEIAAAAARGVDAEGLAKEKRQALQRPIQLPVTIVLDCDFDDLMRDNERISLGAQITRCYSDNKNSKFRAHLTVSSFGGQLKERYETILMGVYKSWKGMRFLEQDFVETADKAKEWMSAKEGGELKGAFSEQDTLEQAEKDQLKQQGEVVYLSSESDETLTELKPYSTYIIGGLVDKNREKGVCHKRATQRGVRTAKLPIGQYLQMSSRKVLATNHVNEIMIKWLECRDWAEAFMHVIPKRKGGKLLGSHEEEAAGEGGGDEEALEEADAADEGQEVTERETAQAEQAEAQDELADERTSSKDPSI